MTHIGKIIGMFFALFIGLSCLVALYYVNPALSRTGYPAEGEIINGGWTAKFEKALGEKLPVYELSRALWGRAEYTLFHQGRKGVIVGADGWLYTDEEFSCPAHGADIMQDNLAFMKKAAAQLAQKNVRLAVLLVPAKERIYPGHLGHARVPSCRSHIYGATLSYLQVNNIPVLNLLDIFKRNTDMQLFLRTDTHWTPAGAQLAANAAGAAFAGLVTQNKKPFTTKAGGQEEHNGDLLRYLPGVAEVPPDMLAKYETGAKEQNAAGLFGDDTAPIALVGTSYSANPSWNFAGFLKQSFGADVLNMADEGQGPFTVMQKYLDGDAWKNSPPQLVLWEVPERYMPVKVMKP